MSRGNNYQLQPRLFPLKIHSTVSKKMASSRKVKTFGRVSDTEEVPSSKSLGEAQLSETPYKHVVRHAVTGEPPSITRTSARCGL